MNTVRRTLVYGAGALIIVALVVASGVWAPAANGAGGASLAGYGPLRDRIAAYLKNDPATYGVYFVDLDSGDSIGINEDMPFPQANTVKVPIVLYANHIVSLGKADWGDRIEYLQEADYRGGAGVLRYSAQPGWTYSLRTLCNLAITVSDNTAKSMLVRHFGAGEIERYMRSLGAAEAHTAGEDTTTARDMAAYMRAVLRLAEENPALGSRMIDDLSNTIWHVGLPGNLPERIRVAHKEGDISGVSNDVGVVYARHPYILCVLSKGQVDTEEGFRRIAAISRIVYDYQQEVHGEG